VSEVSKKIAQDVNEYEGISMWLETADQRMERVSLEILGKARELADQLHTSVTGIIVGSGVEHLSSEAVSHGADKVVLADHPVLAQYTTHAYTEVMEEVVKKLKPSILLVPSTYNGRDLAGRLAVRLGTGLIANVVRLEVDPQNGVMKGAVPGFGGSILAICKCEKTRPQMATVRAGIFAVPAPDSKRKAQIERFEPTINESDMPTRVVEHVVTKTVDLAQAQCVVVAGNGVGNDLDLARKLAEKLGGVLGVTRPLADRGLISRDYQIGSTGQNLHSKVVVVLGASGASHFISGIEAAGLVVAVNRDAKAPIFDYSDVCVVGDLFQVVPALIDKLQPGGK
jgi:electron transfer flavoprotein alpha subunit